MCDQKVLPALAIGAAIVFMPALAPALLPALGGAGAAGAATGAASGGGLFASLAANTSLPFLLAGGSTAASLFGQQQQAEAQANFQQKQAESQNQAMRLNAKLTNANFQNQVLATGLREDQAQQADSQRVQQSQIQAAKAKATARVAAGESGVSGGAVAGLLRDFEQQELAFSQSINLNATNRRRSGDLSLDTARLEAEGRIASVRPFIGSAIEQPNYLGAAIGFGSKSLDIYNQQQRNRRLS